MNIIKDNPFRILGVYSNASAKDIAANVHRITAYLNVNRSVSFSTDIPGLLGTCERTKDNVSDAQTKINLPNDKIKYALFWFVNGGAADGIAIGHLEAGNIDKAKEILRKGRAFSFRINLGIISFIQKDYSAGVQQIMSVIENDADRDNFAKSVCGDTFSIDRSTLSSMFIDEMLHVVDPERLLSVFNTANPNCETTSYLRKKVAGQYIDKIETELATAQSVNSKDSAASYNAGVRLMNYTKVPLQKLKNILEVDDVQFVRIADKLANQILQCGINYYNNASTATRVIVNNALNLQKYAGRIAMGQYAKDRCSKNIDILNKTLMNLPPDGVEEEVSRIDQMLANFNKSIKTTIKANSRTSLDRLSLAMQMIENDHNKKNEGKVEAAISLLNNTKADLSSIKNKLGGQNSFYLKLSTIIVANSLSAIIDAVNKTQNGEDIGFDLNDRSWMFAGSNGISKYQMECINRIVALAWKATKLMDDFDMEASYRSKTYTPNRTTLVSICQQIGIIPKPQPAPSGGSGCMVVIVALIILGCLGSLLI